MVEVEVYRGVLILMGWVQRCTSFGGGEDSIVYRGVLISVGWNRGVLISVGWNRGVPTYTEESSFHGESSTAVYKGVPISGGVRVLLVTGICIAGNNILHTQCQMIIPFKVNNNYCKITAQVTFHISTHIEEEQTTWLPNLHCSTEQ